MSTKMIVLIELFQVKYPSAEYLYLNSLDTVVIHRDEGDCILISVRNGRCYLEDILGGYTASFAATEAVNIPSLLANSRVA